MLPARRKHIHQLADALRKATKVKTPVDVHGLVEQLGGTVETLALRHADAEILKTGDNSFKIKLARSSSSGRDRFSIAHELGHLFLHMGYLVDPVKWVDVGEDPFVDAMQRRGYSAQEYEAHEFAGALLMPEDEFRQVAERHFEDGRYSLEPIARHFDVSVEAAKTRGRWLKLFSW